MDLKPGQTINPGESPDSKPVDATNVELPNIAPTQGQVTPEAAVTEVPPQPVDIPNIQPAPQPQPDNEPSFVYNSEQNIPTDNSFPKNIGEVEWTASEFIDHEKQMGWFLILGVVAVISAALLYLITQDYITSIVIVIAASLFGVTANRKPGTKMYHIDSSGIKIGDKSFEFDKFKSFSVIEEGAIYSIQLTPLARLATPISLYFPPDQEDNIFGMLANYLPHEDRRHDPVDRLMRKIRF